MRILTSVALAAATLGLASNALAELKLPRISPGATLKQSVGLTDVTIAYSRPGVKGRTIWGSLVPLDKPWRTGANEATTITTSDEVKVDGKALPAGTYSLLTIPGKEEWVVVFNREKDLWGSNEYKPEQDALRVTVKPQTAAHEEWMSFHFANLTPNSAQLQLRWEKLMVPVTLEVDAVNQALAHARTEIAAAKTDDWRTAYRSADYAFANNVSHDEAQVWAEKSAKVEENYYNVSLLAKMKAKTGKTKEAVALGEKAVKLGKASKEKVDTQGTETLLAEWTKVD